MATSSPTTQKFDKIINFRDVSSIPNATQSNTVHIRPGLLFRSARPDAASPKDQTLLKETYEIHTILDLRTETEQLEARKKYTTAQTATAPAIQPRDPKKPLQIPGINYRHADLNGKEYSNHLLKQLSWRQTSKLYGMHVLGYRTQAISILCRNVMAPKGLVHLTRDTLQYSRKEIKQAFEVLSDPASYPVLIHCTQGKDRTGLIILLVLALCGVSTEAIEQDYRLSESELEGEMDDRLRELREMGLPDSFAKCPEDWVRVVVGEFLQEYGGVEKYLEGCGASGAQCESVKKILVQ